LDLQQVHFTDEQFYQLCLNNPNLKLERDRHGGLIVMASVGGDSGQREAGYITDLEIWNRQTRLRVPFSASTLFN
jgi:Uma2 family endonuclease